MRIYTGNENTLYVMHLPRSLRIQVAKSQISKMAISPSDKPPPTNVDILAQDIGHKIFEDIFDSTLPPLKEFKNTAEETYLGELIRQCEGNIQKIMEISGLSRSHFYSLLKKYNLSL